MSLAIFSFDAETRRGRVARTLRCAVIPASSDGSTSLMRATLERSTPSFLSTIVPDGADGEVHVLGDGSQRLPGLVQLKHSCSLGRYPNKEI